MGKEQEMNNVVGLETDKDKNLAMLEKLKRESDTIIELYQEVAKIKFGAFKAYVDAGFSREEALILTRGDSI
jgi:hypothetical protein